MSKKKKNVEKDKVFYLVNGQVINNLKELYTMIHNMPEEVFFHHVTAQRNDFSNWVHDVMGDKPLAAKIAKAATPVMLTDLLAGVFIEKPAVAVKPAAKKAEPNTAIKAATKAEPKATAKRTASGSRSKKA
ncbi:MAG: DUF5752 family protein [Bacteroidetes bacterium]|nr:DUF5752 family protein [Bacteroidota bacterium]